MTERERQANADRRSARPWPRHRPAARRRPAGPAPARAVDVVVNAHASAIGDPARALARVAALLEEAGAPSVRGAVTTSPGDLAAAVARAGTRRLLLAGGDGGLHAVANLGVPLPEIALLPAGRANNLARALGVPTRWRAAARLAVRGEARALDALGVVTPTRSIVAVEGVSAGFHAAARSRYDGVNSGSLGAGAGAFAQELRSFHPVAARVVVDGEVLADGEVAQVFVATAPFFAFGFHVDPVARVDDGLLEAIVLRAASRRAALALLTAAHGGRHLGRSGVAWARGARAELVEPVPLVADATPLGVTTATVTTLPGLMRVVRP